MHKDRIQVRIGTIILLLASLSLVTVVIDRVVYQGYDVVALVTDLSFIVLLLTLLLFGLLSFVDRQEARWGQAWVVFLVSGPSILTGGSTNYFGLGIIVMGVILFQRYGMLARHLWIKVVGILLWTGSLIFVADRLRPEISVVTSVSTLTFVFANLTMLYFLFEEEIRSLMAANRSKDAELAQKEAEIARLEPLSVLGERVAHVAHSFKNNLNQVSTALFLLEQVHDSERAAAKLREFSKTLNERIENILMVSRAGVDLEPELFDVARLLEGMKQVYLQERTFLEKAKTVLTVEGPVLVHAVRWDFLLMVENILKNAIEAITEHGGPGIIRIDLARGQLTIANNGGPILLCGSCSDDCLKCPRYGRPGQTTKAGGSGHGLAQVMTTCRNNHWQLKIRTHEEWTLFEIGLPYQGVPPS